MSKRDVVIIGMQLVAQVAQQILQLQFTDVRIGSGKVNLFPSFARRLNQLLKLNIILPCYIAICIFSMLKK